MTTSDRQPSLRQLGRELATAQRNQHEFRRGWGRASSVIAEQIAKLRHRRTMIREERATRRSQSQE